MITARDVTKLVRELFPAPVRCSTATALDGTFRVKLPERPARDMLTEFTEGFLSRRVGGPVQVRLVRKIRRRDYSTDYELCVKVGRQS